MENQSLEIPKVIFDENGELLITASESSSKDDFDFFQGKSVIRNRKLKSRLTNCDEWIEFPSTQEMYKILNGIGNIDNFLATFDGEPFEGMTVRLFNPITKLWSIYWSDSNTGTLDKPVVGSFESKVGHFFLKMFLMKNQLFKYSDGMPETKRILFGARQCLMTKEKLGNGTGTCICRNQVNHC
ncbi:hypothetical protein [Flavobacterium ginsengisoli]|uniref:hypothetical protein n=1 Tax=Flavobacterium ginsengisoli TaxID=871694 RepID=UPI002414D199|nr:hypothetical protein [Flavobacterium ginsengisoli]